VAARPHTGKSLYLGYDAGGSVDAHLRAFHVSFDRPYMDDGLPLHFIDNTYFISWAEGQGYDLTYATSVDLHAGQVNPAHHRGLVFSGHDEYWSTPMRQVVDQATALGRGLAFMSANNMYWHIRFSPSAAGSPHRVVECYKQAPDPLGDPTTRTWLWRDLGQHARLTEQLVLGVQYVAVVPKEVPLVVLGPDHWMWAGTGAKRGDRIRDWSAARPTCCSRTCPDRSAAPRAAVRLAVHDDSGRDRDPADEHLGNAVRRDHLHRRHVPVDACVDRGAPRRRAGPARHGERPRPHRRLLALRVRRSGGTPPG